jgi:iron complex transport system substrate-binding protein
MFFKIRARDSMTIVSALGLALVIAVGQPLAGQAIRVTDDVGHTIALPSPPRRLISLAPSITEILFALGLGDRLIGVTRYCDFPPAALKIEKIGGFLDPDIERIKAGGPDLVIAFRGNPLSALRKLEEIGVPLFTLDIKNELASVPRLIDMIGAVTGRTAEAGQLNQELAAKLEAVKAALAAVQIRPRIFLSLEGQGLWTAGKGSYFNDLLIKAKAVSVTGAINKSWFEYGREALIRDDPDAIVILAKSEDDFRRAAAWFSAQAGLRDLKAVRAGRILFLDQNAASRFGPRLFDAAAGLARLLHPERF